MAKNKVWGDVDLFLMMEMAKKGRVTSNVIMVPKGDPEGVQVGSLRKAIGMTLSIKPEPQMMDMRERTEIEPKKPKVSQSRSFLVRRRLMAEKKKRVKAMTVEVLPG